jgi:uncharacterized protein (UPF0305 family)
MSEDTAQQFQNDLTELRVNPKFRRTVLRELKDQFLQEISEMAAAPGADAEKHRGVVVFIANYYETLAGEPIVGPD